MVDAGTVASKQLPSPPVKENISKTRVIERTGSQEKRLAVSFEVRRHDLVKKSPGAEGSVDEDLTETSPGPADYQRRALKAMTSSTKDF